MPPVPRNPASETVDLTSRPWRAILVIVCALAFAWILVSPAAPSPPTIIGNVIQGGVTFLVFALLPPICAIGSPAMGVPYALVESTVLLHSGDIHCFSVPLRR
jgi:hypothetical protein